jgi:hypothetical protein
MRPLLGAAIGALLLGCDAIFPDADAALPIANLDLEPKPGFVELPSMPVKGPVIEVASGEVSGEGFALSVYRSAEHFCLALSGPEFGSEGCGAAPGEGLPEFERFGIISQSLLKDGMVDVQGMVDPGVEAVWIVTDDGRRASAVLTRAELDGVEVSAFLVFLAPGTRPATIVAGDGSGEVLDEFPLLPVDPGGPDGPGAAPTPAG